MHECDNKILENISSADHSCKAAETPSTLFFFFLCGYVPCQNVSFFIILKIVKILQKKS